ncbi:unnamed protein product [Lampetra planeri]
MSGLGRGHGATRAAGPHRMSGSRALTAICCCCPPRPHAATHPHGVTPAVGESSMSGWLVFGGQNARIAGSFTSSAQGGISPAVAQEKQIPADEDFA